jgi:shikimate kinase / 3-dehydroquinate synthase
MQPVKRSLPMLFFLYGPPGSGKSTLGKLLSDRFQLPFYDLDQEIEAHCHKTIADIFAQDGELTFRREEAERLDEILQRKKGIVALGGGALLNTTSREAVEKAGSVLCVTAELSTLFRRMQNQSVIRPLLDGDQGAEQRLSALIQKRADHYASFSNQLDTTTLTQEEAGWQAQVKFGSFHVHGMGSGYDVRVIPGGLDLLGHLMHEYGFTGQVALVCDETVGKLYAERAAQALQACSCVVHPIIFPAGEKHKTIQTISNLWEGFINSGLDRGSTVVALGGGVVSDLAGFAAATYLRGIRWVAVPTTLLSMADASLGGKTGADLPQGKNLVGAFHPPALVLTDPELLWTLPDRELRSGLAEVVKHGILADERLFARCMQGWEAIAHSSMSQPDWNELVRRAISVKIRYIEADPYEKGIRAALNLGHTIGHAVERASDFSISHGEAVSIGMVAEAQLAEKIQLAQPGLSVSIASVLEGLGLPVHIPPEINAQAVLKYLQVDKKRTAGTVRFALPAAIGDVRTGIQVDLDLIQSLMEE